MKRDLIPFNTILQIMILLMMSCSGPKYSSTISVGERPLASDCSGHSYNCGDITSSTTFNENLPDHLYSAILKDKHTDEQRYLIGLKDTYFNSALESCADEGFRLIDIDVSFASGKRQFSGVFEQGEGSLYYFVLSWNNFLLKNQELTLKYSQYLFSVINRIFFDNRKKVPILIDQKFILKLLCNTKNKEWNYNLLKSMFNHFNETQEHLEYYENMTRG